MSELWEGFKDTFWDMMPFGGGGRDIGEFLGIAVGFVLWVVVGVILLGLAAYLLGGPS